MANCTIGGNTNHTTESPQACRDLGGEPYGSGGGGGTGCFVKNVLTRAIAETIVEVGTAERVTPGFLRAVEALKAFVVGGRVKPPASIKKPSFIRITNAKRRELAKAANDGILKLAATYLATLDFRDQLLQTTVQGRRWLAYYDTHLEDIFKTTRGNQALILQSAQTWFFVFPFFEAVVNAAATPGRNEGRQRAAPPSRSQRFSEAHFIACQALLKEYRSEASNPSFVRVLNELEAELKQYVGLTASAAVTKLRAHSGT